jgi:hydrogenase nickel incorporation protein HypB
LERTLEALSGKLRLAVITGDLQTDNDARRLRGKGAPVIPITTGTLCHLEASMVEKACREIELTTIDLLFIENVGNLVCPAAFALGEQLRIVVLSTTEGEDKPLKYPLAFKSADVVIISKTDLAEAAGFQRDTALTNLHFIAPQARVLELSARTGAGLEAWLQLLHSLVASKSAAAVHR